MHLEDIYKWLGKFRRTAISDSQGRSRIHPRSIYILPTKQGLVLVLVLILMLSGSINYGTNLGYLLTFLLGGIWLTSILHTWRNLLGLTLAPQGASPVFAGQDAVFMLQLASEGGLPRYGISVDAKGASGSQCDISAQQTVAVKIHQPSRKRGYLNLRNVSIHSRYPLGLFRAWSYARVSMYCLVYPKPSTQGDPPNQPSYTQSEDGGKGQGTDDFIGHRNFRYGDSPKHIDWKALAREKGLYCKQFGGDRTDQIRLDWDLMPDVDTETRLSLLCRFILLAEEQGLSYDLKLPGTYIATGSGETQKHRCLSSLARFNLST